MKLVSKLDLMIPFQVLNFNQWAILHHLGGKDDVILLGFCSVIR